MRQTEMENRKKDQSIWNIIKFKFDVQISNSYTDWNSYDAISHAR